jgi:hypothetical protein
MYRLSADKFGIARIFLQQQVIPAMIDRIKQVLRMEEFDGW